VLNEQVYGNVTVTNDVTKPTKAWRPW